MSPGFDFKTLKIVDAVSMETVKVPTTLYPCHHTFDSDTIEAWTKQCQKDGNPTTCPLCRITF